MGASGAMGCMGRQAITRGGFDRSVGVGKCFLISFSGFPQLFRIAASLNAISATK